MDARRKLVTVLGTLNARSHLPLMKSFRRMYRYDPILQKRRLRSKKVKELAYDRRDLFKIEQLLSGRTGL